MHVLKLILGKIFFCLFNVKRPDGLSLRSDRCVAQSAGRLSYMFRRVQLRRPDGKVTFPDTRSLSLCLRGNARPDKLMSRPDRDPIGFINPSRRIFEATPHFLFLFWLLVSDFSRVFTFSRTLLSFCALLSTFQVLF
jgi:hypothetical protein